MNNGSNPLRAPRCTLHVGVRMNLVEVVAPAWLISATSEDGENPHELAGPRQKSRTRKFWKCPSSGCVRVAVYLPTDDEEKEMAARRCPKCGEPSDAPGTSRASGHNYCRKCSTEMQKRSKAKAKARRERLAKNAAVVHLSAPRGEPETLLNA